MSCLLTKPTKWHVHPAKTQISLGICPGWSESSLCAWRKLGSLATHWAHSKDSDQTGQVPRLNWVFTGRTCHFVGFVMRQLACCSPPCFLWLWSPASVSHTVFAPCVQNNWSTSWEDLSSELCILVRLKPICSAKISWNFGCSDYRSNFIIVGTWPCIVPFTCSVVSTLGQQVTCRQ